MTTSTTTLTRPDGRTITWAECGAPEGTPVLWCHGAPASRLDAASDGPFAASHAAAGIRLIAADRSGYGCSTSHPGRTLADAAADVVAVGDALGLPRFAAVGYSFGGPVALAVAAAVPERVCAVGILASVAPPGLADLRGLAEKELLDLMGADPRRARGLLAELATALRRDPQATAMQMLGDGLVAADLAALADPSLATFLLATLTESARADLAGYADDLLAVRGDWAPVLADVRSPVHVVHGREDRIVPVDHGRVLAAALPTATLTEVAGGHLSVLAELPGLLAALNRPAHAGVTPNCDDRSG